MKRSTQGSIIADCPGLPLNAGCGRLTLRSHGMCVIEIVVKLYAKFLLAAEVSELVTSARWRLNTRRTNWPDSVGTDAVDRRPVDTDISHVAF